MTKSPPGMARIGADSALASDRFEVLEQVSYENIAVLSFAVSTAGAALGDAAGQSEGWDKAT